MSITILTALFIIISLLMASVVLLIGDNSNNDRENLSPFECGFDPSNNARIPFSLRFFLVTIIFLIFDVEIALLLPLGALNLFSDPIFISLSIILLTLILVLGLIHEWNQGALNWI